MSRKVYSQFLKVNCARCGNGQIVFGRSSTKVKCGECNKRLLNTTGGKVRVRAVVREVLA